LSESEALYGSGPEPALKDMGDQSTAREEDWRDGLLLARRRLLPSVNELNKLKLSLIQTEILIRLADGRRTATELSVQIYGNDANNPSAETYYARIRRAARDLQRRGFVSTPLLGRDKPYRLTEHGILQIASLGNSARSSPSIIGYKDIISLLSVLALGLLSLLLSDTSPPATIGFASSSLFFVAVGISLTRLYLIVKKVF
jgi:hypothetical protein